MPVITFSKTTIARISAPHPSGKQCLYWDSSLKGFAVAASGVSKSKSYIVQRIVGGKCRRVTVGPCNVLELEQARAQALALLSDMAAGVDPKVKRRAARAAGVTLQEVLDDYLQSRKSLKITTAQDYRSTVSRYLGDWADKPIAGITPEMVERKHEKIAAEVKARGKGRKGVGKDFKGGYAANGTMRVFKLLYNHAMDSNPSLPTNPCRTLKRKWYPEQRRKRIVQKPDMPAFYKGVMGLENVIHRTYILLLLFAGFRRREAARLTWDQIDLPNKVIRLAGSQTKNGHDFDLPMSDYIYDMMVAYRALGIDGDGWVFPANSESGHIAEPRGALLQVAKTSGVYVSPHDLRRTFASTAEACDLPFTVLKGLLNHALPKGEVTAGYVIMDSDRLREPMQKVTDRLKELCQVPEPQGKNVAKLKRAGTR